jgi:hypothetical protein
MMEQVIGIPIVSLWELRVVMTDIIKKIHELYTRRFGGRPSIIHLGIRRHWRRSSHILLAHLKVLFVFF